MFRPRKCRAEKRRSTYHSVIMAITRDIKLNFLFWNTGKKDINTHIADLIATTNANFVAIAEYEGDSIELLRYLTNKGLNFHAVPIIGCERIQIFSDINPSGIKHKREGDRYTIKELHIAGSLPLLVGLVHLPSKLHADEDHQLHSSIFFKQEIELAEKEAGHSNTIIFGDFNMNPFDKGMMSAAAMNSLPCLKTSKKMSRKIEGREHSFFYNPSWNLLGDLDEMPGTYFHGSPSYLSHYWNTLDQVIVRPSIGNKFDKSSLTIIKNTGIKPLINKKGRPSVSDHLPIFFTMQIS